MRRRTRTTSSRGSGSWRSRGTLKSSSGPAARKNARRFWASSCQARRSTETRWSRPSSPRSTSSTGLLKRRGVPPKPQKTGISRSGQCLSNSAPPAGLALRSPPSWRLAAGRLAHWRAPSWRAFGAIRAALARFESCLWHEKRGAPPMWWGPSSSLPRQDSPSARRRPGGSLRAASLAGARHRGALSALIAPRSLVSSPAS